MKLPPLIWLFIGLAVLIIQLAFLGKLEINSIRPDWLLLVVIFVSLYLPVPQALVVNWFLGMFKDITSNAGLGSFGFLFILTGLFICLLKALIFREDFIAQLLITFGATCFCHLLYGLGLIIAYRTMSLILVLSKSFFIALATLLVASLVFGIQFKVKQILIRREAKEIREMQRASRMNLPRKSCFGIPKRSQNESLHSG